jgi:hypothetical protein
MRPENGVWSDFIEGKERISEEGGFSQWVFGETPTTIPSKSKGLHGSFRKRRGK